MRRRTAFTILELLVVIGILAVLMALLFPLIRKVREASLQTVCVDRLRDLATASTMVLQQTGQFPVPSRTNAAGLMSGMPANAPVPHQIETRLLNDLATSLAYPPLTGGVPASQLSPHVQCPFVEPLPDRGPLVFGGTEYYYTGYMYCGGIGDAPGGRPTTTTSTPPVTTALLASTTIATVLQKDRVPIATGDSPGVLWADDLHWSDSAGWQYAHGGGGGSSDSTPGPQPFTFADLKGFKGQHRAYTDGSVRWVPAAEMQLDVSSQAARDASATFKVGSGLYWWF